VEGESVQLRSRLQRVVPYGLCDSHEYRVSWFIWNGLHTNFVNSLPASSNREFPRIADLPSWSWTGWDCIVSYQEFLKKGLMKPEEVSVSIELKSGRILKTSMMQEIVAFTVASSGRLSGLTL